MANAESEQIARSIETSSTLFKRYLPGFDDSNATRQAPGLPNHAIWTLGHLAMYLHRSAEKAAGREIPLRWDPEAFAFGSVPVDDPAAGRYPTLAEMIRRFDESVDLLAGTLRSLDAADLDREVPWGSSAKVTIRDMAVRMVFHNGTHCGQLVDLRRALGLPNILR